MDTAHQQEIQSLAKEFFTTRSTQTFNKLAKALEPDLYKIARSITRDRDKSYIVISDVLMKKIYQRENWKFDDDKPFLSYISKVTKNYCWQQFKSNPDEKNRTVRDREYGDWDENGNDIIRKRKKKIRVLQLESSMIHGGLGDDGEMSDVLDFFHQKHNGTNDQEFIEFNDDPYLHNDTSLLFQKIIQVISQLEYPKSQVLVDAIFNECDKDDISHYSAMFEENDLDLPEEKMSYKEIADKYGFNTPGAIKTLVFRAKEKIKEEISAMTNCSMLNDGYKVNGKTITRYECGDVKEEYNVVMGKKDGIYVKYYPTGEIKMRCMYKNGTLHGRFEEYYPNGTIKICGNYENGRRDGEWMARRPDQTVDSIYDYFGNDIYFEHYKEDGTLESSDIISKS